MTQGIGNTKKTNSYPAHKDATRAKKQSHVCCLRFICCQIVLWTYLTRAPKKNAQNTVFYTPVATPRSHPPVAFRRRLRKENASATMYRGGLVFTSVSDTVPDRTEPTGVCSCGREAAQPGEGGMSPAQRPSPIWSRLWKTKGGDRGTYPSPRTICTWVSPLVPKSKKVF